MAKAGAELKTGEIGVAAARIEVEIKAERARVWEAFCREIGRWWPASFHCLEGSDTLELEARAGGCLIERAPSGASLLWGQVLAVEPAARLMLVSYMAPPYAGPAHEFCHYEFLDGAEKGTTVVRLTTHMLGDLGADPAKMRADTSEGWRQILGGLKAHVEGG